VQSSQLVSDFIVSTHSRPKAAGPTGETTEILKNGFNTQPPEGGWQSINHRQRQASSFNTQPPEGGWIGGMAGAAAQAGFNTQPPEGGWLHAAAQ